MKKLLKKVIAMISGTLLAAMPVILGTMMVQAAPITVTINDVWWSMVYEDDHVSYIQYAPSVITMQTEANPEILDTACMYVDYDTVLSQLPAEMKEGVDYSFLVGRGVISFMVYAKSSFAKGDTITMQLPTALPSETVIECNGRDQWDYSISGTVVTFTCKDSETADWLSFNIEYHRTEEDEFWFKPLKAQLNIAAEQAELSGKAVVAEAKGDFALSYGIMKWLEDHPNVTLKYTLSYKEKDYNIVIKGGQKLADPNIPWYGPEYLIGKFLQ
jgi:hypothetical protein